MLRADRIQLAILNLIIDWSENAGRPVSLSSLAASIAISGSALSHSELVDALLELYQSGIIELGRYVGSTLVRYDATEGSTYFYHGEFRCKALPAARRRQQELSRNNRNGIFISHIAEEKPIALRLQRLLHDALSPTVPIFVSSDYKSIESGEKWYEAILGGLKRSQVVIVLLSRASIERRWINYESGFGMGQEARVIPVVCRALKKGEIGMPLSELHARALDDRNDLQALLNDVALVCHISGSHEPIGQFLIDLSSVEAQIPSSGLEVEVFRKDMALYVTIRNTGNRPLDMVDAELLIHEELRGNNAFRDTPPVRVKCRYEEGSVHWLGYRLTTKASPQSNLGVNPLPETLLREMGDVPVTGLTIGLSANLSPAGAAVAVRYRVSARQESVGPVTTSVSPLVRK
jgi:hypothetical protein